MEEFNSECQEGDEMINFTQTVMDENTYHPTERLIFSIIMPIIITFGLFSNIFLLFVIFKMESMRTITNVYLGSLAAADIIFLCTGPVINFIAMSQSPITADRSGIINTNFGCAMIRSPNWVTYHVSLLLITAVTLEKYWAICKPMYYRGINNVFRTFKIVVGIWLGCLLAGFTFCGIFWSNYQAFCIKWLDDARPEGFPTRMASCLPMLQGGDALAFKAITMVTVSIFFLAMVINIFLYTLIIHDINERITAESKQRSNPGDGNAALKRTKRKQQMVHMLLINAIVHFVLLVPSQLLLLLGALLKSVLSIDVYIKIAFSAEVMVALNSSINPIIYILLNSQYRRSFYNSVMSCKNGRTEYTTVECRPRSTKSTAMDD